MFDFDFEAPSIDADVDDESKSTPQVDQETDQAKDDVLAKKLWDLSVRTLRKIGYEIKM